MQAEKIYSNYENFYATCPHCKSENIFNRADDLKSFRPVSNCKVTCFNENCLQPFVIGNDTVNMSCDMLLTEAELSVDRKNNITAVLLSVQAVEVFIYQFLVIQLIYKNLKSLSSKDLEESNVVAGLLNAAIERCAFGDMKRLILHYILDENKPQNIEDTRLFIKKIPKLKKTEIEETDLLRAEKTHKELAHIIFSTKVEQTRNKVIHKYAYRPDKNEALAVINECDRIITKAQEIFDAHYYDIGFYNRKKPI